MRNIQKHEFTPEVEALAAVITQARIEDRKDRAAMMSSRLNQLAEVIGRKGVTSIEAAELIREEAEKIQRQAMELH